MPWLQPPSQLTEEEGDARPPYRAATGNEGAGLSTEKTSIRGRIQYRWVASENLWGRGKEQGFGVIATIYI